MDKFISFSGQKTKYNKIQFWFNIKVNEILDKFIYVDDFAAHKTGL